MLEKPNLPDDAILSHLHAEFGLVNPQVTFLPLGADLNTAVYRVSTGGDERYFLKLRSGPFDPTCVTLPRFYADLGITQIISPLETLGGQLYAKLGAFQTILYPFVEGRDAYEITLSESQWTEFGQALKALHNAAVPEQIAGGIRKETFLGPWRDSVREYMRRIESEHYSDSVAIEVKGLLLDKRDQILQLIDRVEALSKRYAGQPLDLVVCHSDLHAGNLLIGTDHALHIVDWDEPILAPKERDLMYVGGGLMASGRSAQEEEALFYGAYGQDLPDPDLLTYYRYDRIIRDIAEYCDLLLESDEGGEDRAQSLAYLKANFAPGGTIDIARQAES